MSDQPGTTDFDAMRICLVTRPCWNCDGTGRGFVFNPRDAAPMHEFVPGPCVVCSGRGRLAAND